MILNPSQGITTREKFKSFRNSKQLKVATDPLKQKKYDLQVKLSGLTASVGSGERERIQLLKDQINLSKNNINELRAERDREIENYKSKFTNEKVRMMNPSINKYQAYKRAILILIVKNKIQKSNYKVC